MIYLLFSLLPFVIAIALIIWKEEPILPLILSIFLSIWLLYRLNIISAFFKIIGATIVETMIEQNTLLLIITITEVLILFFLFKEGGHLKSIINAKKFKSLSKYSLEYILMGLTTILSFEEKLSSLLSGIFLKAFAREKNISKERFAFLINNIGPVFYTLIPLTLFTPIVSKIIGSSLSSFGIEYPSIKIYLLSLPFQFYNISILIIIASSVILKRDIPPMNRLMNRLMNNPSNNTSKKNLSSENAFDNSTNTKNSKTFNLIFAPYSRSANRKISASNNSIYSAGISFGIVILSLISAAIILIVQFYSGKTIEVINYIKTFTSLIFGGILYYLIYSIISKKLSIRELSTEKKINSSTLTVVFYIILSSSLLLVAKKLELFSRFSGSLINWNKLDIAWYPFVFFLMSSLLSFLSGSRLAVIYVLIPIAFKIISSALPDPLLIDYFHYAVVGAIISGSTFGIINSPLSPIFIISSASSESSLKVHFISQIYYSLSALFISAVFGYLLSFFRISPYLSITIILLIVAVFFVFGKKFLIDN